MSIKEYQSEYTVIVSYSLMRLSMDKCMMVIEHVTWGFSLSASPHIAWADSLAWGSHRPR